MISMYYFDRLVKLLIFLGVFCMWIVNCILIVMCVDVYKMKVVIVWFKVIFYLEMIVKIWFFFKFCKDGCYI